MGEAILKIGAAVLSYLAARGIDKIIAKWVAYFTIAWEAAVSDEAKRIWRDNVTTIKEDMAKNGNDIVEWRRKFGPGSQPPPGGAQ